MCDVNPINSVTNQNRCKQPTLLAFCSLSTKAERNCSNVVCSQTAQRGLPALILEQTATIISSVASFTMRKCRSDFYKYYRANDYIKAYERTTLFKKNDEHRCN